MTSEHRHFEQPVHEFRKRILTKKWESLAKRGIEPPETLEEHQKRLREAHNAAE
jgi:hypothetical protein